MKKVTRLILPFLSVLLIAGSLFAQANPHELLIPPPTTSMTYINDFIAADVDGSGNRLDPDRVYLLKRNSIYYCNTSIRNAGWVMRMKAEEGIGRKPIIFVLRNTTTGTTPGRIFEVRGNIWLKNIILDGIFEYDPSTIGNMQGALITATAQGFDIVCDGVIFTNSSGNHIRTDSAPRVVKLYNCIFANMGYLGTSNFGAGKALDLRAGSCDSLIVVNNTFVNAQDRIIRHYGSTANIKYMKFDHNTIVNAMSFHGTLSLGKVGKKVEITNNLFYDSFASGNDTDKTRQLEFTDSREYDSRGLARMTWIIAEPNDSTQYTIKKNYYVVSPEGQAWFNKWASAGVTGEGAPLTWAINKKLGADSVNAFKKTSLTLTTIPRLMTAMMDWYRSPTGGNKTKNTPTAAWNASFDYDRKGFLFYTDSLRCTYSTSSVAYTGADKGFPVGDLNWYPALKTLFDSGGAVGIEDDLNFIPVEYALNQNYPNPFNPTTVISYSLPKASNVTIAVFNSIGQEIALLVNNQIQGAGQHKVSWNGKDASGRAVATGVYFYQLRTNEFMGTKKMLLLK